MLSFEPFSLEALWRALPMIKKSPLRCSDISAGSIYMWRSDESCRLCFWNGTFSVMQGFEDHPSFSYPVGDDPEGMVGEILSYARENDLPLRFFSLDANALETLRKDSRIRSVTAACERKWSDYVYSFEDASTFKGRRFAGQRNHINKFKRLYGEPRISLINEDDIPLIEALLSEYAFEHADRSRLESLELERTRALLSAASELSLFACALRVEDCIAAFSIGEVVSDTLIIHVEKALRKYEGAYPVMYSGAVSLAAETLGKPLRYVNREDDSGDTGIRTSKMQYHPIEMIDKYYACVDSPAAEIEDIPVISAPPVVLTRIREEDKAAYLKLNTDVENNKYWGYDYRDDPWITLPVDENTFYDSLMHDIKAGESVNFAVREREDGEMIGEGILWNFSINGSCEVGLRITPEHHSKGYGRAAYKALCDYAQKSLGLRIWARCYHQNAASERMILSCGLKKTRSDGTFYYFESRK